MFVAHHTLGQSEKGDVRAERGKGGTERVDRILGTVNQGQMAGVRTQYFKFGAWELIVLVMNDTSLALSVLGWVGVSFHGQTFVFYFCLLPLPMLLSVNISKYVCCSLQPQPVKLNTAFVLTLDIYILTSETYNN